MQFGKNRMKSISQWIIVNENKPLSHLEKKNSK